MEKKHMESSKIRMINGIYGGYIVKVLSDTWENGNQGKFIVLL